MSDSLQPCNFRVHGILQARMGSLSLLQGIFPTQGWNPGLQTLQPDSLSAEPQGRPKNTQFHSIETALLNVTTHPYLEVLNGRISLSYSVCFILSDILSLQKHKINLSSNTCSLSYWDSHLCVCFYTSLAIVISYFYWIILFPVLKIGDDANFLMKNLFSCPSVITTISLDFSYYT